MRPPALYFPFQLPGTGAVLVGGGAFILWGGVISGQTAAVTTQFRIFDNTTAAVPIIYDGIISGQLTVPIIMPECGVLAQSGLFILAATQAVNGTLYFTPVTRQAEGWVDQYNNRYEWFDTP